MSIKRKSLHGRKLRPKSVVDSVEGLSADDIPSLAANARTSEEEEDSVTELPNATHQLQHLVKGRPRRAKTRAPTRPLLRPADVVDSSAHDFGEGLETFFRPGSVTPTSDECGSFQADGSPNREVSVSAEGRRTPQLTRGSSLLRGGSGSAPRSRSSDNLQRYSPALARKDNSECSPLARRLTGDSLLSRESSDGSIAADSNIPLDRTSPGSTLSNKVSPDTSKSGQ